MIPRFEFGHLYKFVVSVGLGMIIAGIALPWFVLQASSSLVIPVSELVRLTPVARSALQRRQEHLSFAVDWYLVASAILIGLGIAAIIYGFVNWRRRQGVIDAIENIKRASDEATLAAMTNQEVEKKLDSDVRDLQEVEAPPDQTESPSPLDELVSAGALSSRTHTQTSEDLRSVLAKAEASAIDALQVAIRPEWIVQPRVKLQFNGRSYFLDAVATSFTDGREAAFEIKYSRSGRSLWRTIEQSVLPLARVAGRLRGKNPGLVHGVLLILLDEELSPNEMLGLKRQWEDILLTVREQLSCIVLEGWQNGSEIGLVVREAALDALGKPGALIFREV